MRLIFLVLVIFSPLAALTPWGCSGSKSPSGPVTVTQVVTATPVPNAGAVWQLALADTASPSSSQFPERYGLGTAVFNGAMWVVGGGGDSAPLNDSWSSPDGVHWTNVLPYSASPGTSQFSGRSNHAVVAYNGYLWVIGGYTGSGSLNDVWKSADGAHWTNVLPDTASPPTTQFPQRYSHVCLAYNGALWVISGIGTSAILNDVWSSTDGAHWTNVLAASPSPTTGQFPPKYAEGAVVYNGAMWLIGGAQSGMNEYNDVWNSTDGIHWTQVLANNATPPSTQFSQRLGLSAVVYNGALWVSGGGSPTSFNDVWTSTNGAAWTETAVDAAFTARIVFGMLAFNNDMWVIGGAGGGGNPYLNDVWYSP
jgi:hypothetical protein